MVTVIVPTYNEARLIESKLDGIARQDYPEEPRLQP
jgi:glycosyltransferase involved in cell wall biosynthesis